MSHIQISSNGWLAISFKNGTAGVFNLNDICSWQYLQHESSVEQFKDEEENNDCHCNLIKFSPNGEILVFTGENKQLNVYVSSDFEKTEVWWEFQRIIVVKNHPSSLELTNEYLLIADINGDIYQIDLSLNDKNQNFVVTEENCMIKNLSILLDLTFIRINDKESFLLISDQDNKIRLTHYPNTSNIEGYCSGHTEFISHIKIIDHNHILSASGDGTFRLWRLPECVPLVLLHSKAFTLSSKQIFYTQLCDPENFLYRENSRTDAISDDSSSIIDYSIWKMDVVCCYSNIYIAFSTYAHRSHSIYLTSLTNLKQLANEQRKIIFDLSYGTIVDYCFPSKECLFRTNSKTYLYILFDSNILLQIDILSILRCNERNLFAESNETIQEINNILTRKEFHLIDSMNNNRILDGILFKQLFKNSKLNSNENSPQKRKIERIEQEQRKKQASSQDEDDLTLVEYF